MTTRGQPFQMLSLQALFCVRLWTGKFPKSEKNGFFFFFFLNGIPVEMSFQKNVLIMEAHQLARTFTVK